MTVPPPDSVPMRHSAPQSATRWAWWCRQAGLAFLQLALVAGLAILASKLVLES